MTIHGNTGTYDHTISTTIEGDLRAFDSLGPASRRALREADFNYSAAMLLKQINGHGFSPNDPRIECAVVEMVHGLDRQNIAKYSTIALLEATKRG